MADPARTALRIWAAGVRAADPTRLVAPHLDDLPSEVWVVGGGKAAAAMADGVESVLGSAVVGGMVVVPAAYHRCLRTIEVALGGHPVPTEEGVAAVERMLQTVPPGVAVVACISGGATSCLAYPHPDRGEWERLLRSGLPIDELNAARNPWCTLARGGLARALGPRLVRALVLSDVPGDDFAVIGSGPTLDVGVDHRLVGSNETALAAAEAEARHLGYEVVRGEPLRGEAAEMGDRIGRVDLPPGTTSLHGGETTVRIDEPAGKGGRNQELALAASAPLAGRALTLLSAGTDGIDGNSFAAGAVVDGNTAERLARAGIGTRESLRRHDSHSALAAIDALVVTGATFTNVMDVAVLLRPP